MMIDEIVNMINDGLTWPEAFFLVGLMVFVFAVGAMLVAVVLYMLFED